MEAWRLGALGPWTCIMQPLPLPVVLIPASARRTLLPTSPPTWLAWTRPPPAVDPTLVVAVEGPF